MIKYLRKLWGAFKSWRWKREYERIRRIGDEG